ncbi:hypothetical protein CC80DRAFT_580377 [Byssothecium circinans]|uniref:Fatty acid hydroxylase domain-containing protein n=1 Tax=Byssothecium circinans TaxID=147558 RepID=A0A6A5UCQ5_9PLEO|nr:hypothetical protein CC80DRAFT_580377 [Byssothecium circinans]
MSDFAIIPELPTPPTFTLEPAPPLLRGVPDRYVVIALPILAYWAWSLMFYFFDTFNLFEKYRIHTPDEIKKRNLVPIREVILCILIQQLWQVALGLWTYPGPYLVGQENYDIALWATTIRQKQQLVPNLLALVGVNSKAVALKIAPIAPSLAGFLHGGGLVVVTSQLMPGEMIKPAFAPWEIYLAKLIYYYAIPAVQFSVAIFIGDTWQYWMHRISHRVPWIYNNFHSVHHRVYCPYPFGAFYANLVEAFVWDVGGTALALWFSRLNQRQALCFTTLSTMKSCDDHCGYNLPFDPLQWINAQRAAYHDIHHQSWGMKTNFSQVYTTVWDWVLDTQWTGNDTAERYKRGQLAAERAIRMEKGQSEGE